MRTDERMSETESMTGTLDDHLATTLRIDPGEKNPGTGGLDRIVCTAMDRQHRQIRPLQRQASTVALSLL